MLRALALLLAVAACERSDGVHATRAQCDRLGAEMHAMKDRVNARYAAEGGWRKMRVFGDSPERCMEQLTAKQVECSIKKYRADTMDTSACMPAVHSPVTARPSQDAPE